MTQQQQHTQTGPIDMVNTPDKRTIKQKCPICGDRLDEPDKGHNVDRLDIIEWHLRDYHIDELCEYLGVHQKETWYTPHVGSPVCGVSGCRVCGDNARGEFLGLVSGVYK